MFDVIRWNIEHGLGAEEVWADQSFSYEEKHERMKP